MPFQPGQSGNPSGSKTKRQWIKEKERIREARATWKRLLRVRDDLVLERKTIMSPDGPIEVDVVPSAKDYIACCKEILNRAIGLPKQEVELSGDPTNPVNVKTDFDFAKYNELFTELSRHAGAVHNGNGAQKSVYPPYPDGETGDLS